MFNLRSKKDPSTTAQTSNVGLRDWYLRHGYEEVSGRGGFVTSSIPVIGENGTDALPLPKRGKKSEDDQPPTDLSALADELSKGDDE